MNTEYPKRRVTGLRVTNGILAISVDGQQHRFELAKFSRRLAHGTSLEQEAVTLSPASYGLHWPLLDEDLTIDSLIAGKASMESDSSFKQWLSARSNRPNAA